MSLGICKEHLGQNFIFQIFEKLVRQIVYLKKKPKKFREIMTQLVGGSEPNLCLKIKRRGLYHLRQYYKLYCITFLKINNVIELFNLFIYTLN